MDASLRYIFKRNFLAQCLNRLRFHCFGLLILCLLSVTPVAHATRLSEAHPQVTFTDVLPEWVQVVTPNEAVSHGQLTHATSQGFYFSLLNLQHQVRDLGVDYYVGIHKKITQTAGLKQANLEIEFDPIHEKLIWHTLQIRRGDQRIDVRQRAQARVIDREKSLEAAILFGRKTLFVIVPDVRVGDVIEYSYVLEERNPLWQSHFFLTRYLSWQQPVERYFLRVQWPESRQIQWAVPPQYSHLFPIKQGRQWVFEYDSGLAVLFSPEASIGRASAHGSFSQAHSVPPLTNYFSVPEQVKYHMSRVDVNSDFDVQPKFESNDSGADVKTQAQPLVQGETARLPAGWAPPRSPSSVAQNAEVENRPTVLPMVEFSEFDDWAVLADWVKKIWADSNQNVAAQQIYALWRSLVQPQYQSPHADPEARVLEVIHWVQDQVRYFGLELGVGSLRPRSPELVLHSRFGDCKDKSLLLITLLQAMGLDAAPVLVHTAAARLPYQLPTPAAFNHVIVELPWQGQRLWIDATRAWQGGRLRDLHVAEYARGLVLAESEVSQWRERPVIVSRNETEVKTRVMVNKDVNVNSTMTVTTQYHGQAADMVRAQLQRHGQDWFAGGRLSRYQTFYKDLFVAAPLSIKDDRGGNTLGVTEYYEIPKLWQSQRVDATPLDRSASDTSVTKMPQASRFYADALYPLIRALEAQLALGEAVVPAQRVRHELEIVLPDSGWQIPEAEAGFSNPHFTFTYESGLRGQAIFLGYELKPLLPTEKSFREDVATISRDLGRIKNVLVFELTKTETVPDAVDSLVSEASVLKDVLLSDALLSEKPISAALAVLAARLSDRLSGQMWIQGLVHAWGQLKLQLFGGAQHPLESRFWDLGSGENQHASVDFQVLPLDVDVRVGDASTHHDSAMHSGSLQSVILASLGQLAHDKMAQLGLLICLVFWLCVRLVRRLRKAKQADGVYRPSATMFAFFSVMTLGLTAMTWLLKNYGYKRARVRMRYWVGDLLGRFPTREVLWTGLLCTLLGAATVHYAVLWPLLFTGFAFMPLCSRVQALHCAAKTGTHWTPPGAAVVQPRQAENTSLALKKPRAKSVAA